MGKRVVIIGDGNVGSALSYALFIEGVADRIAIIDTRQKKVEGDVLDLLRFYEAGDS